MITLTGMPPTSAPEPTTGPDAPDLARPRSIFDLLNFRVAEFYGLSGSLVTRLCEGEFGVTREEWQFVAMLAALGELSQSELTRRTTVDRSQCSRTLRALAAKQLVFRERMAGDARRARIGLTEGGRALYAQLFPRVVAVHQAMLSALDADEVALLARCLQKMQRTAEVVARSDLVAVQADRRRGGSRRSWHEPASFEAAQAVRRTGPAHRR